MKTASKLADEIKLQFLLYQNGNISYDPIKCIDHYWTTVSAFVDTDGKCCLAELATLAIDYLCVSHGNAIPERGLSINKQLLQDRSLLKEKTIEALRFVKESIELHSGNVSYTYLIPAIVYNFNK